MVTIYCDIIIYKIVIYQIIIQREQISISISKLN